MGGGSLPDLVKIGVLLMDVGPTSCEIRGRVRREFFGDRFPASTKVEVRCLVSSEWLVEIEGWGVVYVMAGEQSTITPPFGLSLFVLQSVVPQHKMGTIVKGSLPFLIPIYLNILLLILLPQIALWLPSVLKWRCGARRELA